MKSIKIFLLSALILLIGSASQAQTAKINNFFGNGDTLKTVTTKTLTLTVQSPGVLNFFFAYDRISDTVTAVVTLQHSPDKVRWYNYPGVDTIQINSASRTKEIIIQPSVATYMLAPYWRFSVTSSKANGEGKLYAFLWK